MIVVYSSHVLSSRETVLNLTVIKILCSSYQYQNKFYVVGILDIDFTLSKLYRLLFISIKLIKYQSFSFSNFLRCVVWN